MNKIYKNPMISIGMITYNHEKYISQAVESVLMQKVNFEYEIIVGEDCSIDNTRKILLRYKEKYPDIINLILQKSNVGIFRNLFVTLNICRGKYIAFLEGDDYWVDEYKLQKQVDFLESNLDYGMIHTRANLVSKDNELITISENNQPSGDVFDHLIFKSAFIITCTTCFRKSFVDSLFEIVKKNNINYLMDYYFWTYFALHSKIHFLNEVTSAHRTHPGGITKTDKNFCSIRTPFIVTDVINERFKLKQNKKIKSSLRFKYALKYSGALLSRNIRTKDKIKRLNFFKNQFYLIPALFVSLFLKMYLFIKRHITLSKKHNRKI